MFLMRRYYGKRWYFGWREFDRRFERDFGTPGDLNQSKSKKGGGRSVVVVVLWLER